MTSNNEFKHHVMHRQMVGIGDSRSLDSVSDDEDTPHRGVDFGKYQKPLSPSQRPKLNLRAKIDDELISKEENGKDGPRSQLESYLSVVGEKQRTALEKFYNSVEPACHNLMSCEQFFGDDSAPCQQLHFLSCNREAAPNTMTDNIQPCAYCERTGTCLESCQRPKYFFLKKKPPFAEDQGWDENGYPVQFMNCENMKERKKWMSSFF